MPPRLASAALTLLLAGPAALAQNLPAGTLPSGGRVVSGTAGIASSGTAMTVTQGSNRAVLEWQGFNLGSAASVTFQQPGATAWALNRVVGPDPSVIAGRISANGGIILVNQSGVVFAEGAQVNVGNLVVSAANITNQNFNAGTLAFTGPPNPGARIENRGGITVAQGGMAALVGPEVANSGTINARLGRVLLAGAETFTLDLSGDGLLALDVTQAVRTAPGGGAALVTNSGTIMAEGGSVHLTATAASGLLETLVANTGTIAVPTQGASPGQVALRANGGGVSVGGTLAATGGAGQRGGTLEVTGTGNVTVASGALLDASGGAGGGRIAVGLAANSQRGAPRALARRTKVEQGAMIRADATVAGDGGSITVHSTENTTQLGSISARGGPGGGAGGQVEISSLGGITGLGTVNVLAPMGAPGTIVIDPDYLYVYAPGTVPPSSPPAIAGTQTVLGLDYTNVDNATLAALSGTVVLTATSGITVGSYSYMGFPNPTTGTVVYAGGNLVLQTTGSGASIAVNQPITVSNGSLGLQALGSNSTVNLLNDISASGGFSLYAPGATFTNHQTGSNLTTSGGPVSITAGGFLSLSGNILAGNGDVTITGLAGSTLSLGGSISANTLVATAPQFTVEAPGLDLTLGRAALIAAPGGMTVGGNGTGSFTLSALNAGSYPALVLDGRASGALTSLPGFVQADSAGSQPTQLSQFGTSPSSTAAQAITLGASVGSSPVFILADGGTVSGTLSAGRLGLLGTGGSAALTGQLGGLTGSAAATLATTRIGNSNAALRQYLFNGSPFQGVDDKTPVLNPVVAVNDTTTVSGSGSATSVSNLYGSQANLGPYSEDDQQALAEAAASDPAANAFTRRSSIPAAPVQARPSEDGVADPDLELPNTGGRDF